MQRVPSCAYCFKTYAFKGSGRPVGLRIPRLLSCGHTFCDGCVSKLVEVQPSELSCPTCGRPTSLPGGKKQIKDLPTNLYILGILINNVRAALEKDVTKGELTDFDLDKGFNFVPSEAVSSSESALGGQELICDECCTNTATTECHKCEAVFCKTCFSTVHSSSRTLRSHEGVPLTLSRLPGFADNGCATHDGKQLEFYDKSDEKLVCSLCVVDSKCHGHDIVPMTEMCKDVGEKIKQSLENVKKVHDRLQRSRRKLSTLFPEIKTECGEVVQRIREHFQELHTRLQAREVDLVREVKKAYCNESLFVNVSQEIIQRSREVETLIEQGTLALSSPSFIMKGGEELLSKLATVRDTPCIVSQSSVQDLVKVSYPTEFQNALDGYGEVFKDCSSFHLRKLSGEPEDISPDITSQDQDFTSMSVQKEDSVEEPVSPVRSGGMIMSLPPRQNLVYVTHIKNPCDFMVQHAADAERLENLMDAVNHYCAGAKGLNGAVKSTQIGDMVCAQYSKDRYWYRARIIGQQQRPNVPKSRVPPLSSVEVCFIDYGNTEVVPLNRLRKIRPEFMDIPELAMNCSLVDIVPPTRSETWPAQSIKAFGSLTREKALLMNVLRKSGGKLYVDLKSPDEEPTQDDDKPASVRDAVVFLDVARFSSPASNPKISFPVRSYKKAVVPEEGETLEVIVTYPENPDEVYVMRDTGKEYADTMRVISQMSTMYSSKKGNQWRIMWPYKGLLCAARFSGDKVWYRALVTAVVADQFVQVTYVDFGNSEELPFSEIRRLPDHMAQLPMQAIKCRLAAVKPIDEEKGWSDDCCTFLSDTCTLNRYWMKVVEVVEDGLISVVLYQMDVDQTTSVNKLLLINMHAAVTDASELESLQSESLVNSEVSSPSMESTHVRLGSSSRDEANISISGEMAEQQQVLFPQKLMYKPVELPSKSKFEFSVTYVDKDCTISGYQSESGDQSLPELMKHVQKICSTGDGSSVSQDQLSFNQPCCAQFSEDSLWYRAEIVDFPSESTVLVDYVDFGNQEKVPLTSIKLNAPFLEIPKQCLSILLEGLPRTPVEQQKVSTYLSELLIGRTCQAATRTKSLVNGLVQCGQLTLPDGSDVVEVAKEQMLQSHVQEVGEPEPLKSSKPKDEGFITKKSGPLMSLISETFLPEEGIPFDVTVTQVDKPNIVFLQRIPPTEDDPGYAEAKDPTARIANDHLHQLVEIAEKINMPDYFKNKPEIMNLWPKILCCGRYTQDDLWYRAQVLEVESIEPPEVRVLYVDYGTSEVIGPDRLKSFPSELLSLPKQAFCCSVVGLPDTAEQEAGSEKDLDTESTTKAVDSLIKVVAGKKLICKVVAFESPVVVELYERVFSGESYCDVPLHERLFELMMEIDVADDEEDAAGAFGIGDHEDPCSINDGFKFSEDLNAEEEPEKIVLHENQVDDSSEKPAEWISRPGLEAQFGHLQLITPAQFCLKKDGFTEMKRNIVPEAGTSGKPIDCEEVD